MTLGRSSSGSPPLKELCVVISASASSVSLDTDLRFGQSLGATRGRAWRSGVLGNHDYIYIYYIMTFIYSNSTIYIYIYYIWICMYIYIYIYIHIYSVTCIILYTRVIICIKKVYMYWDNTYIISGNSGHLGSCNIQCVYIYILLVIQCYTRKLIISWIYNHDSIIMIVYW